MASNTNSNSDQIAAAYESLPLQALSRLAYEEGTDGKLYILASIAKRIFNRRWDEIDRKKAEAAERERQQRKAAAAAAAAQNVAALEALDIRTLALRAYQRNQDRTGFDIIDEEAHRVFRARTDRKLAREAGEAKRLQEEQEAANNEAALHSVRSKFKDFFLSLLPEEIIALEEHHDDPGLQALLWDFDLRSRGLLRQHRQASAAQASPQNVSEQNSDVTPSGPPGRSSIAQTNVRNDAITSTAQPTQRGGCVSRPSGET